MRDESYSTYSHVFYSFEQFREYPQMGGASREKLGNQGIFHKLFLDANQMRTAVRKNLGGAY